MKKLLIVAMLGFLCSACTPSVQPSDNVTNVDTVEIVDTTVVDTTSLQ